MEGKRNASIFNAMFFIMFLIHYKQWKLKDIHYLKTMVFNQVSSVLCQTIAIMMFQQRRGNTADDDDGDNEPEIEESEESDESDEESNSDEEEVK